MADQEFFRLQSGPQASKLSGLDKSLWDLAPRVTCKPHAKDIRILTPTNSVATSLPSNGSFNWAQDFDRCDHIEIEVTVSALTAGGAATYTRLVDWFGAALWRCLKVRYSGQDIQQILGEEDFLRYHRQMTDELRPDYEQELGGNLTAAERNTLALAEQKFFVCVPVYFTKRRDLALNPYILSQPLELFFETKQYKDLIETDDTTVAQPFTIGFQCRSIVQHTLPLERAQFIEKMRSGNGMVLPFPYMKYVENNVIPASAGASQHQIDISSLQLPVKILDVVIRKRADVTTDYARKYNSLSWDDVPDEFELKCGGVVIIRRQKVRPLMRYNARRYGNDSSIPLLRILFTEIPQNTLVADGAFLGLDQLRNNVFLELYYDAAIPADLQVTVVAECFNALQRKAGTERRLFA